MSETSRTKTQLCNAVESWFKVDDMPRRKSQLLARAKVGLKWTA